MTARLDLVQNSHHNHKFLEARNSPDECTSFAHNYLLTASLPTSRRALYVLIMKQTYLLYKR